jgi:hypothetical protein
VTGDRTGLGFVDDPAPEKVTVVGRERVDGLAVSIESEREVLTVLHPEVSVEPPFQRGGLLLEPARVFGIFPDQASEPGTAELGVVGVSLRRSTAR